MTEIIKITKTGALPDELKKIYVAANSFENGCLCGCLYHTGIRGPVYFKGLTAMAQQLEAVCRFLSYPSPSLSQRTFDGDPQISYSRETEYKIASVPQNKIKGALGEFCLCIKYRYHATWQGEITNLRSGEQIFFFSFLELARYLFQSVGASGNRENTLGGQDLLIRRIKYTNELDLLNCLENSAPFVVWGRNEKEGLMLIQVLFGKNHTYQGVVRWTKRQKQIRFRSFLELLLLLEEAGLRG